MKKAFSLVELIVVIGIIGVLAGILFTSFSGGTESARAAKCLSNMRNLAQVTIGYAARSSGRHFPYAGSYAVVSPDEDVCYKEHLGWISWLCKGDEYASRDGNRQHPKSFVRVSNASAYSSPTDDRDATFAITNGLLWKAVNGNRDTYVCPTHARTAEKAGVRANWSYVMNAYFGYDWSDGSKAIAVDGESSEHVSMNSSRLDRTLLFAELPFNDHDFGGAAVSTEFSTSPDTTNDAILQYKCSNIDGETFGKNWDGKAECIAFNHKSGKRWCAHVVFADGHIEKLLLPKGSGGLTKEQLTALLCGDDKKQGGKDVGFSNSGYVKIKD